MQEAQQAILPPEMSSGVAAMDELHQDFFAALTGLASVSDKEFGDRYRSFVEKAERAFFTEEKWMEEIDFPILKSHREQHARVLGALHNVHARVMDGDLTTGREVVEKLLPQWFIFHMSTMDVALASAMLVADAELAQLVSASPATDIDKQAIPLDLMLPPQAQDWSPKYLSSTS